MKKIFGILMVICLVSCAKQTDDFVSYVDTKIGTGAHGHVFVGASVPFGAVQLGPTSVPQEWDWCSGYHASDSTVIGFSHTHLSGTGIGDLFDVTVLPVAGEVSDFSRAGIADKADRTREVSEPGYYSVPLQKSGVLCEMTATARVGLHKYTFTKGNASVIIDLQNGGCWDRLSEAALEAVDETHFIGHRHSRGWANDQKLYFAAEFSKPFTRCEEVAPNHWRFDFDSKEVMLKLSISPASEANASSNMAHELPGWDFASVRSQAREAWNAELGKVKIETSDVDARKVFYTAMYHSMIAPSLFCDYGEPTRYTTLSLWDTYRAAMPLYSIIHSEKENDLINSFLDIYDKQGDLPVWHLMGCETDCMVGNPGASVVSDAILKGFDGFDAEKAFEALKATGLTPDRGQQYRMKYGYIPFDLYNQSVATDQEYAIADWAIAQAALKLGHQQEYEYFLERSHSYRRYFDAGTGFMRGVDSKGQFRVDFDPYRSEHETHDYTEGNAWQYTWLAPHDFQGLCECFRNYPHYRRRNIDGHKDGSEALIQKLDSLFVVSSEIVGENVSPDISGLIGQYAHGNEPSHHIIYFYTMAGQPWKAAKLLRRVYSEMYTTAEDGICGNEDVGQMSSWYILSTLGFYQVEPAGGRFWFGSPLFDKAEISVGDGKIFTVIAENNSSDNMYIQRVYLNGHPYTKGYIDYADIMAGGELRFVMGNTEKLWYCAKEPSEYQDKRPAEEDRLFKNETIEKTIAEVQGKLQNPRLAWMFGNCFPNTLDTTVNFTEDDGSGHPDTFVITGDIHAMWLRDSGAQVWPYLRFANDDEQIRAMLEGTIRRQLKCLCIDPYANAFNIGPTGTGWMSDNTEMKPELHERKWEIDSQCYPIRLAYGYWKKTGDASIFDKVWVEAMEKVLAAMKDQQRKENDGKYWFLRSCDRQYDMKCNYGYGNPVNPVGLIVSSFRPSDDATVLDFLVPSNFFAVTSLRKAAEILESVNGENELAGECRALAAEVADALDKYAVYEHPEFGRIYAYEVDGFGNRLLMDDSNVPSLLAMAYLGDVDVNDPVYQNTRRFVLSASNPYRFEGAAGVGIGGPHIGPDYIWPMSIMMRAFTSQDDAEIETCIMQLMTTDAGTGFMHEAFNVDNPSHYTREWFAWQNTLFGELILKLIDDGKLELLNGIL
ncbi:MAG: GH92 family glycosyl hydrolase [Bacteroidales bacterium]|nr:GH92 family glycosyl hydrolase [Bacteroidales bacterium]